MSASYDLAVNYPLRGRVAAHLAASLATLPMDAGLLAYPPMEGGLDVREAIAGWMRRQGGHAVVDPRRLVLTLGARHALSLALDETCAPGDTLLVESMTYHGFRATALARGIHVTGVAMDEEGMLPDALARAAVDTGARTVYLQPTLHNPTTATMSLARRQRIVDVAAEHDLTLIEGDVYAALAWQHTDALPPLVELAPELCLHAGGIGKVLGPGLRIGWLLLPDAATQERATSAIRLTTDGLPALLPTIVGGWMAGGTADDLLATLGQDMARRNALARELLGNDLVSANGLHAWLPTDDAEGIEARARGQGVRLSPSRALAADGVHARGVRVCLGAEEDVGRLEAALRILAACR